MQRVASRTLAIRATLAIAAAVAATMLSTPAHGGGSGNATATFLCPPVC